MYAGNDLYLAKDEKSFRMGVPSLCHLFSKEFQETEFKLMSPFQKEQSFLQGTLYKSRCLCYSEYNIHPLSSKLKRARMLL